MTNDDKQLILQRAAEYMRRCNELAAGFKEHEGALAGVLNRCLQDIEDVKQMQVQVTESIRIVAEIATHMRDLIERVNGLESDDADWWKQ